MALRTRHIQKAQSLLTACSPQYSLLLHFPFCRSEGRLEANGKVVTLIPGENTPHSETLASWAAKASRLTIIYVCSLPPAPQTQKYDHGLLTRSRTLTPKDDTLSNMQFITKKKEVYNQMSVCGELK